MGVEDRDRSVFEYSNGRFFSLLENRGLFYQEQAEEHPPALYLAKYLKEVGAATIVVEEDYVDGDYLDDYARYYVRCFSSYEKRCRRLHFFSYQFDEGYFSMVISKRISPEDQAERIDNAYLGFVIVKPLPSSVIGKTVLATYSCNKENGHRKYPCTRTYSANLFGIELSVESLAYQEQDLVVARCATVALWSAFQKTSKIFNALEPRPAEITDAATANYRNSRSMPSSGLSVEQMCSAVAAVGLEQELFDLSSEPKRRNLLSLVYGYLRYGLPVLLAGKLKDGELHAITLTGYSCLNHPARNWSTPPPGMLVPMRGRRIDKFYAHDDQVGPFSRIEAIENTSSSEGGSDTIDRPSDSPIRFVRKNELGEGWSMTPTLVVVPVYHKIRLTFVDVQEWVTRLHTWIACSKSAEDLKIEWDVYLVNNSDLKREIAQDEGFSDSLRTKIRKTSFPRYVWRASLELEGSQIADFLIDATDVAGAMPIKWIVWYDNRFREEFKARMAQLTEMIERDVDVKARFMSTMTPPLITLLTKALATHGYYASA